MKTENKSSKNKILDLIHTKIHELRMIQNYKPSNFEIGINKIICNEYKDKCNECKERLNKINNQNQKPKQNLGDRFKNATKGFENLIEGLPE